MKKIYWGIFSLLITSPFSHCVQTSSSELERKRKTRIAQMLILGAQAKNNPKEYRRSLILAREIDDHSLIQTILSSQNMHKEQVYSYEAELNTQRAETRMLQAERILTVFTKWQIQQKSNKELSTKQYRNRILKLIEHRTKLLKTAQSFYLDALKSNLAAFDISGNENHLAKSDKIVRILLQNELFSPTKQKTLAKIKEIIATRQLF